MLNYYRPGTVSRMQIKPLSEPVLTTCTYVKILSGSEKGGCGFAQSRGKSYLRWTRQTSYLNLVTEPDLRIYAPHYVVVAVVLCTKGKLMQTKVLRVKQFGEWAGY